MTDQPNATPTPNPSPGGTPTPAASPRDVREWTIEDSDRMSLVYAAVRLAECLAMKQSYPMIHHAYAEPAELSEPEEDAYRDALAFLRGQFREGPRAACKHLTKLESQPKASSTKPEDGR